MRFWGEMMDLDKIKEQFNYCAQEYDKQRRYYIPCYDDFYTRSVSLLRIYRNDFKNIVDLGVGTGLLTREIYELYPEARYTLIDISKDMLTIAKERFAGLENFEFIECNYGDDIPVTACDLICSGLSIHHLENEGKARLYENIYRKLDKGGCLINLDQFNEESSILSDMYDEWWRNFIDTNDLTSEEKAGWAERRKLDREISIRETMELMKNSGFETAECVYKFMKFGVVMAIK
jgi:ubiquinone/menaquinone biosynthesis C-methylase UbiE